VLQIQNVKFVELNLLEIKIISRQILKRQKLWTTHIKKKKICTYAFCGIDLNPEEYDEHMSVHKIQSEVDAEDEHTRLRRQYGFESRSNTNNYKEQYQKSLENDLAKNKITKEEMEEKMQKVSDNLLGNEVYKTWGLIPLIKACYARTKSPVVYYICENLDHYSSDRGDSSWGCGYRNIQMMASFLLNHETFKKCVFAGNVPTIPSIQEWIERAWARGFDVQGHSQLGSIFNTKKMIGTTECAALFRSFGARANIVDFYSARNPNPPPPTKKKKPSPYFPNKELIKWVWDYFSKVKDLFNYNKKPFLSPLYLQHEGHSRTIVGIEKRGNSFNLLLFDPSQWGSVIRTDLLKFDLNRIRKGSDSFTKEKYQIVYIENETLVDENEQERLKYLDSVKIYSKAN